MDVTICAGYFFKFTILYRMTVKNMKYFWQGFEKRAIEETLEVETPELLSRSVSKAGPKIDELTLESDRDKYKESWRGW